MPLFNRVFRARLGLSGLSVLLVAACSGPSDSQAPTEAEHHTAAASHASAAAPAQDLAKLRRLTAPFHDFEKAQAAGWNLQIPRCRDNPPVGGMGWHYANPAYLDGELDVEKPEILLYEPQRNGKMKLVAVEYIVPYSILPADAEPPTLLGQQFHPNSGDEVWMLHVWLWEPNPDGMFANWNPRVSCRYAE